jgi:hypothetical protein
MQPSTGFRLAPASTEQAYRDQQKIEALARYVSAVRSNASGIPLTEMNPSVRRKNESYLDTVPESPNNSRRSGDHYQQATVSFAPTHTSSPRQGTDPPASWETSAFGMHASLVSTVQTQPPLPPLYSRIRSRAIRLAIQNARFQQSSTFISKSFLVNRILSLSRSISSLSPRSATAKNVLPASHPQAQPPRGHPTGPPAGAGAGASAPFPHPRISAPWRAHGETL